MEKELEGRAVEKVYVVAPWKREEMEKMSGRWRVIRVQSLVTGYRVYLSPDTTEVLLRKLGYGTKGRENT